MPLILTELDGTIPDGEKEASDLTDRELRELDAYLVAAGSAPMINAERWMVKTYIMAKLSRKIPNPVENRPGHMG